MAKPDFGRLLLFLYSEFVWGDVLEELAEVGDDLLLVDLLALELDGGLLDDALGRVDGGVGADGEGDRVGGTRVDLELRPVLLDGDRRVEGVVLQLGDGDADDLRLEL